LGNFAFPKGDIPDFRDDEIWHCLGKLGEKIEVTPNETTDVELTLISP
jgi:hypothetical protein